MTMSRTANPISRRSTLTGLAAGSLGLAMAARSHGVSAQEAPPGDLAEHPIVGTWLMTTAIGPGLAVFAADGIHIGGVPTAQAGPQGVTFTGAQAGTWEPTGPRSIHFTGVQLQTDASGAFVGSVTIDGHPRVSEDGQTIVDESPEDRITVRDAAGNVVDVFAPYPGSPTTIGVRMGVGAPGFPTSTPDAATPGS